MLKNHIPKVEVLSERQCKVLRNMGFIGVRSFWHDSKEIDDKTRVVYKDYEHNYNIYRLSICIYSFLNDPYVKIINLCHHCSEKSMSIEDFSKNFNIFYESLKKDLQKLRKYDIICFDNVSDKEVK